MRTGALSFFSFGGGGAVSSPSSPDSSSYSESESLGGIIPAVAL